MINRKSIGLFVKKGIVFCSIGFLALSMVACTKKDSKSSSKKSEKKVDIEDLASTLNSDVKYDTKLKKVDDSVATTMISLADGSKMVMYMGDGTKADTIIVIKSASGKVSEDEEEVKSYKDDMEKSFEKYLPEEAKKMKDADIHVEGDYIVCCVTKDEDTAEEIIDKTF
ncbi:MAG: DUF4358 domain-containing protein [Lachnospiraceae bacterium]|nr:DUF4358 domain-containing protein [Lachnospiraceae bacterium]